MRKLLIVFLLLVVAAVAGDLLLRVYAEERAGAGSLDWALPSWLSVLRSRSYCFRRPRI